MVFFGVTTGSFMITAKLQVLTVLNQGSSTAGPGISETNSCEKKTDMLNQNTTLY